MKPLRIATVLIVLAALVLGGVALAEFAPAIPRYVIGGGGGHVEAGGKALDATLGEPLVGTAGRSPFELCAGFWCLPQPRVLLPVMLRD